MPENDKEPAQSEEPIHDRTALGSIAKSLGPGVITGASDDDPSGIATYSQAGAAFGYGMLWLAIFQYPLMTAVQEMCARIGLVTGGGLGSAIRKKYSKKVLLPIASLLLAANTINIGADIGAMAASVRLLLPQAPFVAVAVAFTFFILAAEVLIPYSRYVKILKYLTLSLFAYIATTVIVSGSWSDIAVASLVPHIELDARFAMMLVAIFGTTISPYLFFWQAAEEAEEDVVKNKIRDINKGRPKISRMEVKVMRRDVAIGMAFSQLVMWAIVVTTAGSLHVNGVTDVKSVEQAARALEPLVKGFPYAGEISRTIFALGIIGTGLLAVPVLAGSSGYALADAFGRKEGLNKKFRQAKAFYLVIIASTATGMGINFFANVVPMQALVYAAIINCITAVPILYAVIRIANDGNILGKKINGRLSNVLGYATLVIMAASVAIMFATWGR
ncbi:MAG: divalent metal cation transporter [Nitrososphaera sp.]